MKRIFLNKCMRKNVNKTKVSTKEECALIQDLFFE